MRSRTEAPLVATHALGDARCGRSRCGRGRRTCRGSLATADPTRADLTDEFGLARVSFGAGVPAAWRPYYLRELQTGLRDMAGVFPGLSFQDVHIHFGSASLRDSALAMHDPRNRTIELPIATSGGTLAHELSHDLDWQAARRLFADGGGYSTRPRDARPARRARRIVARTRRGAAATSVRRIAPSRDRPAEFFARGADWFVASALAQQGRTNGFLSAIEDGVARGYAAGAPTAVGAAGTASLVSAIEEMTYLPDSIRRASSRSGRTRASSIRCCSFDACSSRRCRGALLARRPAWDAFGPAAGRVLRRTKARPRRALVRVYSTRDRRAGARHRGAPRPVSPGARSRPGVATSILGVAPWSPERASGSSRRCARRSSPSWGRRSPTQGVVPAAPAIFRSSAAICSSIAR